MKTSVIITSLLAGTAVALPLPSLARDAYNPLELVITPTKKPTPIAQVGSSVTVITAEEIERKQAQAVTDILKSVPGVDVARSGGQGQIARVFLRGTETNHVLVLIDDVEVNDPSSPDTAFDFAHLVTDNIERIEVLRGPQGTLYGSEAIGGVISITTKRGQGAPRFYGSAEAGSYNTYKVAAGVSGKVDNTSYSLNLSQHDSNGFSAVSKRFGTSEADGYRNQNLSASLNHGWAENFSTTATLRYTDSDTEYDDSFPLQDADNLGKTHELVGRVAGNLSLFDGVWEQEFGVGFSETRRKNEDSFPRVSDGERTKFDWLHHFNLSESNTLSLGLENERQSYTSEDLFSSTDVEVDNKAIFLQDQFAIGEQFFATVGVRVDDHELAGTKTTYRIAPVYNVAATGTKLKASYGTGFKAPALYELFDGFYGNPNLEPEESRGFDVGFEQTLLKGKLFFGSTYFQNDIDNLISSDPITFAALNIGSAKSWGVENTLTWQALDDLALSFNYTYTRTEDEDTGEELLRRARHKFGANADYRFWEQGTVNISADYIGSREDSIFPGRVDLKPYLLVNIAGAWELNDNFTLFGRVENLLDHSYEEVYGFANPGLSAYTGVKVSF